MLTSILWYSYPRNILSVGSSVTIQGYVLKQYGATLKSGTVGVDDPWVGNGICRYVTIPASGIFSYTTTITKAGIGAIQFNYGGVHSTLLFTVASSWKNGIPNVPAIPISKIILKNTASYEQKITLQTGTKVITEGLNPGESKTILSTTPPSDIIAASTNNCTVGLSIGAAAGIAGVSIMPVGYSSDGTVTASVSGELFAFFSGTIDNSGSAQFCIGPDLEVKAGAGGSVASQICFGSDGNIYETGGGSLGLVAGSCSIKVGKWN